jgi:predicted HTH transcriptional regulator
MGAIPSTDMPGHRTLRDRVSLALGRCQETQSVDFKESAPWEALQWKIIATCMAMANLRDGGIIVIGASERGSTWGLTGVSGECLGTYDVDAVIDRVNAFASPPLELDIVTHCCEDGKTLLVLRVREFSETPIVCRKNGPGGKGLREGAVYVRPPGMARTTVVTNAAQMHELLELAAEKRARRILEVSRRVGMVPGTSDRQRFDEELEGL